MEVGELDRTLILKMLLEHERRLRRIDGELREVRRQINQMEELRERLRRVGDWSSNLESMR